MDYQLVYNLTKFVHFFLSKKKKTLCYISDENIKNCILQSITFKKPELIEKNEIEKYNNRLKEALEQLKYIVEASNSKLINVFRLDSSDGTQDIELTILRALLNCKNI